MSKILLMLNQKRVIEDMSIILKLEDYEVIEVSDEVEGKNLISRERPDLVIVDNFNGTQIVKDIKKAHPKLAVLCWMQERDSRLAVDLMINGAIDCLCPPLRAAEILEVINHALGSPGSKKGTRFLLPYINFVKYKKPIITVASVIFLLLAVKIVSSFIKNNVVDLPNSHPAGIVYDGKNIWVGDWYSQSIYKYKLTKKLELLGNYYFAGFGPSALTLNKKHLWSAGNDLVLRQHILNENLEVIRTYNLAEHSPSGIVVIEDDLWLSDASSKVIFQYLIGNTLTLINKYYLPLSDPVGLVWDGNYMWVADVKTRELFAYRKVKTNLILSGLYQLPVEVPGKLAGIYPVKKWIYVIYSGTESKLCRYKIKKLKRLNPNKYK